MRRFLRELLRRGRPLRSPGGVDGEILAPCPRAPCCVSSQSERVEQRVEPIGFGDREASEVRARILTVLEGWPRTRIATADELYVHAECQTFGLHFTDDLELVLDPERRVVQVRSCSRLGYSDLGVNRRRVEALRRDLVGS